MTGNPPRWEPDNEPFDPNNCKGNYILKYRKPVPCPQLSKWGKWFDKNFHRKQVRRSYIGDKFVSTVFLGIDHNYGGKGDPVLFETMIGSENRMFNDYQTRCCTWREALAMHKEAVAHLKNNLNKTEVLRNI